MGSLSSLSQLNFMVQMNTVWKILVEKCKGMKKLGIYIWTCKNKNDDEAEFMASFDVFICSNSFLKEKKKHYRILALYQVDTADTVFIGNPESVDGGSRHLCQSLEKERT